MPLLGKNTLDELLRIAQLADWKNLREKQICMVSSSWHVNGRLSLFVKLLKSLTNRINRELRQNYALEKTITEYSILSESEQREADKKFCNFIEGISLKPEFKSLMRIFDSELIGINPILLLRYLNNLFSNKIIFLGDSEITNIQSNDAASQEAIQGEINGTKAVKSGTYSVQERLASLYLRSTPKWMKPFKKSG
jgi:hypothetical protein